jgi:hypothetical protein
MLPRVRPSGGTSRQRELGWPPCPSAHGARARGGVYRELLDTHASLPRAAERRLRRRPKQCARRRGGWISPGSSGSQRHTPPFPGRTDPRQRPIKEGGNKVKDTAGWFKELGRFFFAKHPMENQTMEPLCTLLLGIDNVVHIEILHVCSIYHWQSLEIFLIFFETSRYKFKC